AISYIESTIIRVPTVFVAYKPTFTVVVNLHQPFSVAPVTNCGTQIVIRPRFGAKTSVFLGNHTVCDVIFVRSRIPLRRRPTAVEHFAFGRWQVVPVSVIEITFPLADVPTVL